MALSLAASQSFAGFEGPSAGANLGDPSDPFDSFDAVVRVGIGQNDNVMLWPDLMSFNPPNDDTRSSMFLTGALDTIFRHQISPLFTIGAALRADGTTYIEDIPVALQPAYGNFDDFDLVSVNPSVFANVLVDGIDVRFVYGFRWEDAQGVHAIGLNAHQIGIQLSSDISATWRIRAGVSNTWNDFHIVFPDPVNDRDSTLTAFDVGADYYIGGGRTVLSATANVAINDSDGSNWKYTAYGATLGARTVVMPGLFASGEVGYEHRDYRGFDVPFIPPPGREEQNIFSAKAKLVYAINERFSADVHVNYATYDSNMPQFEGDQTIVGAGLTTKLY
jgi:hypothetical protein